MPRRRVALAAALTAALVGIAPAGAQDVPIPGPTLPSAPAQPARLAPPPDDCTIEGTEGPDRLAGTPGPDVICGHDGDDVLEGLEGDDVLDGGEGIDTATWESSICCVRANLEAGTATGSMGADQLVAIESVAGSQGTDVIRGDAGGNVLTGHAETDLLFGGEGDDWLAGGDGDDWLAGEGGANVLDGGPGANVCADGPGTLCEPVAASDRPDVRGPLDISLAEGPAGGATWRITSRGRLAARRLWDDGYVVISFDTRGGEEFEVHALVRWDRRQAVGLLLREGARSSSGRVGVRRAGARGILVTVSMGQLDVDPLRLFYRWAARSIYTGAGCRPCLDGVPEQSAYPEPLVTA